MEQPKRDAPSSHHHLARAVSTAARFNDALTEPATQRKSARIACAAEPFRESVARIARKRPREAGWIRFGRENTPRRDVDDQRTAFGDLGWDGRGRYSIGILVRMLAYQGRGRRMRAAVGILEWSASWPAHSLDLSRGSTSLLTPSAERLARQCRRSSAIPRTKWFCGRRSIRPATSSIPIRTQRINKLCATQVGPLLAQKRSRLATLPSIISTEAKATAAATADRRRQPSETRPAIAHG